MDARPAALVVRAAPALHAPLVAHLGRRLRARGWSTICATARPAAPLFREVATHVGLTVLPSDPPSTAEAIAIAARGRGAAILAQLPAEGSWDFEVACELLRVPDLFVVFVSAKLSPWVGQVAATYQLGDELEPEDRLRWFAATVAEGRGALASPSLATLESWWDHVRDVAPERPTFDGLDETQRELATLLALLGRSVPIGDLLESHGVAVSSLVTLGVAERAGERVALAPSAAEAIATEVEANTTSPALQRLAAKILVGTGFDPCPWAYARAAELLLSAGDADDADELLARAVRSASDVRVVSGIVQRWFDAVSKIGGDVGVQLRVRAAERALASGEAQEAQRWCESVSAIRPGSAEVALLMGRSLLLLGDLVAARVSLQRALTVAESDERRAEIAAALAEVAYVAGELEAAAEHAARAISLAETATTRLEGRNILGKIHLAAARWNEADEHFAEDAIAARDEKQPVAELRARLNRAIVMMAKARLDDARAMLERVLEEGTERGEDRARVYALRNLAVIAYRQHDYARALALWDTAVRFPPALAGRITSAFTLANLADLRLRLGLLDHTEHTLGFGRRMLAGQIASATAANFGVVAARLALARGNVEAARREVDAALASATKAGDSGDRLPDAYLVAARVALEEGDVRRAGELLDRAEAIASNDRLCAEVAIVRALHLRAAGLPAIEAALSALASAKAADEEDLLSEIHVLLALLYRDVGSMDDAEIHCRSAIAIRDRVAADLPADVRAAFLAKAEIVALSRLAASLTVEAMSAVDDEAPQASRPRAVSPAVDHPIVGDDPKIRALLVAVRKVARSNSTVLVRGESGTGKELVAAALHRESERAAGPLVSVNCAALVETLLLSELFGHEKGAFTGATARKRGRFELAEGGTLFLDEIGDISPRTQVALLRVLQEKTFERVGGTSSIRANVRVVCATHRDLRAMVERGEFREDLYYRLQGVILEVPPLRQRLGDLPKLAAHLLARIAVEREESPRALAPEALELLVRHKWPGNVRELENVLRAASLFCDGATIRVGDLVENVEELRVLAQGGPSSRRSFTGLLSAAESGESVDPPTASEVFYAEVRGGKGSLSALRRQIERDCIVKALGETSGNITRAANLLGMKRPRLSQLVKQYGLLAASGEASDPGTESDLETEEDE